MGLLPGIYHDMAPRRERMSIAEDAFFFLEPAIRIHCPAYSPYAHYGVTAVSREQWENILVEWDQLPAKMKTAIRTKDMRTLHKMIPKHLRKPFMRDRHDNCFKLSKLIAATSLWIRTELSEHEVISILGI
jgi:hypothetical protein